MRRGSTGRPDIGKLAMANCVWVPHATSVAVCSIFGHSRQPPLNRPDHCPDGDDTPFSTFRGRSPASRLESSAEGCWSDLDYTPTPTSWRGVSPANEVYGRGVSPANEVY